MVLFAELLAVPEQEPRPLLLPLSLRCSTAVECPSEVLVWVVELQDLRWPLPAAVRLGRGHGCMQMQSLVACGQWVQGAPRPLGTAEDRCWSRRWLHLESVLAQGEASRRKSGY